MANYENGKIYKVVNSENDNIYIGSTTKSLHWRMVNHISQAKLTHKTSAFYQAMRQIGTDKFEIIFITSAPSKSKAELYAKEYDMMSKYLKKGVELYNTNVDGHPKATPAAKLNMSRAQAGRNNPSYGKLGSKSLRFKRGSVSFVPDRNCWRFFWVDEDRKKRSKSFSVNKHGAQEAHRLALDWQEKIWPSN